VVLEIKGHEDDQDRAKHQFCDWSLIQKIAVVNSSMKTKVEEILRAVPLSMRREVEVQASLYY
jgi:hypothetical protein